MPPPQHTIAGKKWVKPKNPFVKANCDATLNLSIKSIGYGSIIQDSQGNALLIVCNTSNRLTTPLVAGAIALRKITMLCWELQLSKVIFEGECL